MAFRIKSKRAFWYGMLSAGAMAITALIFTNATPQKALTFAEMTISSSKYDQLEQVVLNGGGPFEDYLNKGNRAAFENEWPDRLPPNPSDLDVFQAKAATRAQWIKNVSSLSDFYLRPLSDQLRADLKDFGFIVKPPSNPKDFTVAITQATGAAALTPFGANVNRIRKYDAVTILDPLYSVNPMIGEDGRYEVIGRRVLVSLVDFFKTNPGDMRSTSMTYSHEASHAHSFWKLKEGKRDLNFGFVDRTIASRYIESKGAYGSGFYMDEVPAHRLTFLAKDQTLITTAALRTHRLAAASIEAKIKLFDGIGSTTQFIRPGQKSQNYFGVEGTVIDRPGVGYMIIAGTPPENMTVDDAKNFIKQSIAKSILAMERATTRLTEAGRPDLIEYAKYQMAQDAQKLADTVSRAPAEIFGPRLSSPHNTTAVSPGAALIESQYGPNGVPQKMASFENNLNILKSMRGDFSKLNTLDGNGFSAGATARMTHIENTMEHTITGETWTPSEISNMPNADMSRTFAKNLTAGVKVAGAIGVVLFTKEALAAVEQERFTDFITQTIIAMPYTMAWQIVLQGVGGALGGPPGFAATGAAIVIAGTLAEVINMTIVTPDNALKFFNWFNTKGGPIAQFLTRLIYAIPGNGHNYLSAEQLKAMLSYSKVVLKARPPEERIIASPPAAATTPEQVADGIISGLGLGALDLDPGPGVSLTFGRKGVSDGSSPNFGTAIDPVSKLVKVQIRIRYVCSAFLYLKATTPRTTGEIPYEQQFDLSYIPAANASACEANARESTAYIQSVFDNSAIPVKFTYTYEMEADRPWESLTPWTYYQPGDLLNGANEPDHIPAVTVTGLGYGSRKAIPGQCAGFSPTLIGCTNQYATTPANPTYPANGCQKYPQYCDALGNFAVPSSIATGAFLYNGACTVPLNSPCWCDSGSGRFGGYEPNCKIKGMYAHQQKPVFNTGNKIWNACGCMLGYFNTVPGWPTAYAPRDINDAREWVRGRYRPGANEWTLTVAVVPVSGGGVNSIDSFPGATGTAIYDAQSNYAMYFNNGIQGSLNASNLFTELGYFAIAHDNPAKKQQLAHMIGHFFGGVHERAQWGNSNFFNAPYTNLVNREAASNGSDIMMAAVNTGTTAQFTSDTPIYPSVNAFGDAYRNNRNQVIRTLMMLTGNQIVDRPTGIPEYNFGSAEEIVVPPPQVDVTGGVSSTYNMGQTNTIYFSAYGSYAVLTASCSIDGGPFVPCTTNNSFTLPTSLAGGNHYVTIRVTDLVGNVTQVNTSSFYIDPAPIIIPIINSILIDD